MNSKPMSKERRAGMLLHAETLRRDEFTVLADDITDALADSQYWREAVRDCTPRNEVGDCSFCGFHFKHGEDCPWKAAQE